MATVTNQQLNLKSSSRLGTINEREEDACRTKTTLEDRSQPSSNEMYLKVPSNLSLTPKLEYDDYGANPRRHFSERVPSPKPIVHEELSPSYIEDKRIFPNIWRHQELIQDRLAGSAGSKLTKKEPIHLHEIGMRQKSMPPKNLAVAQQVPLKIPKNLDMTLKNKSSTVSMLESKATHGTLQKFQEEWELEENLKFQSALEKLGRLDDLVIQLQQQVSRSRATQIIF
jgi:hypothetical protein